MHWGSVGSIEFSGIERFDGMRQQFQQACNGIGPTQEDA